MKQKGFENEREQLELFALPMKWDRKNIFKNLWNKENDRLFPPKNFGIGWSVNLHAVLRKSGIIKAKKE